MGDTLTCDDLRRVEPALPCCGSCHDEWDEGYGWPCECVVGAVTLCVCCMVLTAMETRADAAQVCAAALAARTKAS